MKKRGLAGIIYVVLSVLLVLLAILIIRIFLLPFLSEQGEITEVKRDLLAQEVLFSKVTGPDASGNITLLIYRGQAKVLINSSTTIQTIRQNVDVFSVTDLSASMNCQAGPNCSNANQAICESPACGGTWLGPMNAAKLANNQLVAELLNLEGNRVGLAAFSRALEEDNPLKNYYHQLSTNAGSLNTHISSWAPFGGTCTCCGLRKALDNFDTNSASKKIIVLMSDGAPTEYRAGNCDGPNQLSGGVEARNQAIAQAQRAVDEEVAVYAIGFGAASDQAFLQEVANITNGSYHYADVGSITQIYASITEEIFNTYSSSVGEQFMLLVFYNNETSATVVYNNPPQNPFETQLYNLISPIPNPQRVEIYLGIRLESGSEVISQFPIDTWEF